MPLAHHCGAVTDPVTRGSRPHPPHAHSGHPVLGWLLRALPQYPGNRIRADALDDGLYLDGEVGPRRFVKPRREHRQEVARVVSVVGTSRRTVGRVEIVAEAGGGWEVRFVALGGEPYLDVDPWWVTLLETHYDRGGEAVDLPLNDAGS